MVSRRVVIQKYEPQTHAYTAVADLLVAFSVGMAATPTWAAPGDITTVAGASVTPTAQDVQNENFGGFSGDGGAAKKAQLRVPSDVAVDGAGNLYCADSYNNRIRKIELVGAPMKAKK